MRNFRILILITALVYGFIEAGIAGVFYAFILFGVLALVFYMVFDCLHAVASFLQPREPQSVTNYSNTLKVDSGVSTARRGQPDGEEWGAIIETQRQGRKGNL